MREILNRVRKHLTYEIPLWAMMFSSLNLLHAEEAMVDDLIAAAHPKHVNNPDQENNYTINFKNISIIEFIRFVSKITGANFVFEEGDLPFNVTIVSEEPVSSKNVMSALVQVLRVHGLTLLEQENNLLITKSKEVNQIATIVSPDVPESETPAIAIVTRVFRIKNANLNTLAGIIKPMMSVGALVEVSNETRQLIVTDVTTNVDKIATLFGSLDAPHTSLEIDTYVAKNVPLAELITLATQIVAPFAEGNPLIFVPQPESNSIFIVSTPYLIDRAMTVLEDLDTEAKVVGGAQSNVFIYKPQYRSPDEIILALNEVADQVTATGTAQARLVLAIKNVKLIPETGSLLFIADEPTTIKLKELLDNVDVTGKPGAKTGYFLYKLLYARGDFVIQNLKSLANSLQASNIATPELLAAINTLSWVKDNNSLLITGSTSTIDEVKGFIAEFDTPGTAGAYAAGAKTAFFIYKPINRTADQIKTSLLEMAQDLEQSGLIDPNLFQTLSLMKVVEATNSIIFTGTKETLDKVKDLLVRVDTPSGAQGIQQIGKLTFLIYKPVYVAPDLLMTSLKNFAAQLPVATQQDKDLVQAINSAKWIKETNSLLFTGNDQALTRIEDLLKKFDNPTQAGGPITERGATYVLYAPRYQSGQDLIGILCDFKSNLISSGVSDPGVFDVIDNIKYIDKTNSLLVSGDETSIKKVQDLLIKFDVPAKGAGVPAIESFENTNFLVYKLQYHQGEEIQTALKQIAKTLDKSENTKGLAATIDSLQWMKVTNSLLGTGPQDILIKLKELIANLDIPLRQVFIEVLVIQASLLDTQNFGLQWGGAIQFLNKLQGGTGNFPVGAPPSSIPGNINPGFMNNLQKITGATTPVGGSNASVPFTQGFDLGVIGDIIMHKGKSFISLGSLVSALQQDSDSVIVINQTLIAQDSNTSTIFVGQNIPYTGSLVTSNFSSQNILQSQNIEYRDVGVNLSITPRLGESDVVTLDVYQDISQVINSSTTTSTNLNLVGITTSHTNMSTRVHVPNETFIVLSGQINDSKTHFKTGIPCLGGLPVIGALFSESDRTDSKGNLIIFMRPHIITSYDEYRRVTEHQEFIFKDQASLPILKEEIDQALDIVKTPANE